MEFIMNNGISKEIMMSKSNKKIGIVIALAAALSGCGETSDELDDKLTHNAKITFINSLNYMADFYLDKRSISTGYSGLFDNDNAVSRDVPFNEVGITYGYSYKVINNMINLGVRDSINGNNEERMTTTLSNGDNLWVIAWKDSNDSTLSVISKKKSNNADVFNVRLFANGNYNVSVANSNVLTTEKGKVTEYLKISDCAEGLKVADKAIDLCSGDFGASYLLVVDANGKLVMAEE